MNTACGKFSAALFFVLTSTSKYCVSNPAVIYIQGSSSSSSGLGIITSRNPAGKSLVYVVPGVVGATQVTQV